MRTGSGHPTQNNPALFRQDIVSLLISVANVVNDSTALSSHAVVLFRLGKSPTENRLLLPSPSPRLWHLSDTTEQREVDLDGIPPFRIDLSAATQVARLMLEFTS